MIHVPESTSMLSDIVLELCRWLVKRNGAGGIDGRSKELAETLQGEGGTALSYGTFRDGCETNGEGKKDHEDTMKRSCTKQSGQKRWHARDEKRADC
jgi:hypothetical protein